MAKAKEGGSGGPNCGVGSGGFQPGNTCAAGGGGGKAPAAKKLTPAQKKAATEKAKKAREKERAKKKKEREKAAEKKRKEREKAKAKKQKEREKAKKQAERKKAQEKARKEREKKKVDAAAARKKLQEEKAGERAGKREDQKKERPVKQDSPGGPIRHDPKVVSATHQELTKHSQASNLSADQTESLKNYTSFHYFGMNSALRRCGDGEGCLDAQDKATYDHIQSAFREGKAKLPKPTTVYRGVTPPASDHLIAEAQAAIQSGKGTISSRGMVSTSVSSKVPDSFGGKDGVGVTMRIKAKTGLYLEGITKNAGEYEILQNHGTKYRPVAVTRHGKRTIIDLEEI